MEFDVHNNLAGLDCSRDRPDSRHPQMEGVPSCFGKSGPTVFGQRRCVKPALGLGTQTKQKQTHRYG